METYNVNEFNVVDKSNNVDSLNVNKKNLLKSTIDDSTADNILNLLKSEENETNKISLPKQIYRFKFTEEFMTELHNFSKIHQYDSRQEFKEAWDSWIEENSELIDEETDRLEEMGYTGDVADKMFKSARYYFRNKSTEKTEPRTRRRYISVSRELLVAIDKHIDDNIYNVDFKPKTAFVMFINSHQDLVKETISSIYKQGITNSEEIQNKLKKTYNNRYFVLTNNS